MASYLERIQEIYKNTPMSRLMEYWQRAQSISSGDVEKAEAVCSNMLSLSEPAPSWWTSMSKKKKKHFLNGKRKQAYVPKPKPATEHDDEPVRGQMQPEYPPGTPGSTKDDGYDYETFNPYTYRIPGDEESDEKKVEPSAVDDTVSEEAPEEEKPKTDEDSVVEEDADEQPVKKDAKLDPAKPKEKEYDDEPEPDWWHELSKEGKKVYLEAHPRSNFAITPGDTDIEEEEPAPLWWHELSTKSQEAYLKKYPKNKLGLKVDDPVSIKSAAKKAWAKKRNKSAAILSHHKTGLHALKTLFSGGEVTHQESSQAKKTAILGTKLILGALVGIALFTALAPAAVVIANMFLNAHGIDSGDHNAFSSDGDEDFSGEFLDKLHDWLMEQDLAELSQKIAKESKHVQSKSA